MEPSFLRADPDADGADDTVYAARDRALLDSFHACIAAER